MLTGPPMRAIGFIGLRKRIVGEGINSFDLFTVFLIAYRACIANPGHYDILSVGFG